MTAIEFHDHPPLHAAEVNNVRPDRMLATELNTELMPSQTHPEFTLGVGLLTTQPPCAIAW